MLGIALEGPDGIGKSTQSELIVDRLQQQGMAVTLAPSLNPYIEGLTGLNHTDIRRWRTTDVTPSTYAYTVLRAHRKRVLELTRCDTGTIYVLDRGMRTHEASCLAIADFRRTTLPSAATEKLRAAPDLPQQYRIIRIALMYATPAIESATHLGRMDWPDDTRYIDYHDLLRRRLFRMWRDRLFSFTLWLENETASRIQTEILARLRHELEDIRCR